MAVWIPRVWLKVAVLLDSPEIVADVFDIIGDVAIEKFTELELAGTVTVEGTFAAELEDVRSITNPPGGAAPLSEIVPVTVFPPATAAADSERPVYVAGKIDRLAD